MFIITRHNPPPATGRKGFTLIEAIITMGLGIILAAMILSLVSPGLRHIRALRNSERLLANADFLSNTLTYWVKQSKTITLLDSSAIQIRLPDSSVKTIEKTGGQIMIDGVPFSDNNTMEVTELAFTKMARSVRISFTLRMKGAEQTIAVITTIAQRNIPL